LLGVDAVAFGAGQFADAHLVGPGSALDTAVTGGGQVAVPVRVVRRSALGCEDVDGVRLGVVREVRRRIASRVSRCSALIEDLLVTALGLRDCPQAHFQPGDRPSSDHGDSCPGSCAYAGLVAPAVPAGPQLIDRGALLAALDRAAARRVTVISAPAGSGKTSLLRAWVSRLGQPCRLVTLTVRRDQQDAQQFWLAVLHAVRQASDHPSTPEPPAPTPAFNGPAMVDRVRSELASDPGPRVLV